MNNNTRVTIYGMGLIGAGWTTHLLIKGVRNIVVYDIAEEGMQRGLSILNKNMDFLVGQGVIDEARKQELIGSITVTTDTAAAVKDADIIIENAPENVAVKQQVIAAIEEFCGDEAVISTSTSGLPISKIVAEARRPQRIIGAHPYHPVYLLPLLEIIKCEQTEVKYIEKAMELFRAWDKKPVLLQKECDGYIGSHLMTVLLREAMHLVTSGVCTMEDIDDAFTYGPGMRYALFGIFTTLHLGGGDGGFHKMVNGPIGKAGAAWLKNFANWEAWPQNVTDFFADGAQKEVDAMLAKRDEHHGRTSAEIEKFRDEGLVKILQAHKLL